ncbi:MAG: response regulator [Candidatus Obscuribacterales bacterium]
MRSLLLVEDNNALREVFRLKLTDLGLTVHEAADGWQAIQHARLGCCQLVLMDIILPNISGLAAAKAICENDSEQVVVLMTAGDATRKEALAAGASDLYVKPVLSKDLEEILSKYLPE